ncbi:DNA internalization-related competence protein ComEC/Rec2 [Spongiibacter nanhainus]|uniref:DNA internalization-related competence protein ComEC/Rec2 n=2 Tax=Spongiibacter nanhainus TaxID=2794344 RepID=A0A7T4UNM6_9GAMM|nr:DNA internalization-related competence protein ComEC/Rec2 [Spongiibacter nanhainus]
MCCVGALYASLHGHWRLAQLLPAALEKQDLSLRFEIVSLPERREASGGYYRFDARLLPGQCYGDQVCPPGRPKFRLNWYTDTPPQPGSHWQAQLRLRQPRGYASPGAFDYGRWLFARGYSGLGYLRDTPAPRQIRAGAASLRQQWVEQLRGALAPYANQGLMRALLFADREGISPVQWRQFSATGTSHLMAISGMHIGMVLSWGLALGWFTRLLVPHARWRLWLTLGLGAASATSYAWLAGFTLPTQRALIMAGSALLLLAQRRFASPWSAWSLALLLVLIWQPLAAHQAGFWMSFIAVACLIGGLQGMRTVGGHWQQGLRAQTVVVLGLVPVLALWGFGVSLWAIPANLIAIPAVALCILPLLIIGLIAELCPGVSAAPVWTLADQALGLMQRWLSYLAEFGGVWQAPVTGLSMLIAVVAVILLLMPRGVPGRLLALPMVVALLYWPAERPPPGRVWLHVLDVGQGLSVWAQTARHNLLFDLGPAYDSGFNTADTVVVPAIRRGGIDQLDTLVISHADTDHRGDSEALLASLPVARGVAGEPWPGQPETLPWVSCYHLPVWQWDGVVFRFLGSPLIDGGNNNRSCVLHIETGQGAALIPGDIEASREAALLARYGQDLASDLLIAPHHGSKTSSTEDFIDAVAPSVVVFSAGYKHAYGHPAEAVVARYQRRNACQINTAYSGTVTFELGDSGARVRNWSRRHRYYWEAKSSPPCAKAEP